MRFLILSLFFVGSVMAEESVKQDRNFGVRLSVGGGAYAGGISNTINKTAADASRTPFTTPDPTNPNAPPTERFSVPDYTKYISAGWVVPLQLEGTYSFSNAFEILLGIRYGFSGAILNEDTYIMKSIGAALGYRYYLNTHDPIQAYMSGQLAMDLTQFVRLEGKAGIGFLFEITPLIGIFVEGNMMLAGLYNSDDAIGKGGQLGAGLGTGLHLHF